MPSIRRPHTRLLLSLAALAVPALALCPTPAALSSQPLEGDAERPWEKYILAPDSREVRAERVHASTGQVTHPQGAWGDGAMVLGKGAQVTLDFGLNIGGILNLSFGDVTGRPARVGVAFSETARYVERQSEASTGGPRGRDGTVWVDAVAGETWTAPPELLRGAFRYVTLFVDDEASVT